ncbi:hypothetical protein SYNPS1DRAFT_27979 [Syncephalis pseudoplumigaleata]|uniref:Cytochrome c oxidase assembly protein COX20, mitochondrial n=1 Tax=Syncephalis pseudoplumigaleata TaxID=1712513 RepID=A0A4P9Z1T0_9FUNG|nr:hypothetical protein SYNPS1DRAFT_27979 [Syncephalis pseudoplumigaleata]|eukprot:RKP26326.1 hypothetical protein SYNPS1DRAFT_27979 [Syncephalis pseudoplumigaleata]
MAESTPASASTDAERPSAPPPTASGPSNKTWGEALQDVSIERMRHIGKVPCARDSLLYGIGGGVAVGVGRFIVARIMQCDGGRQGIDGVELGGGRLRPNIHRMLHAKKVGMVVEKLNQLEEKRRQEGVAITVESDTTSKA